MIKFVDLRRQDAPVEKRILAAVSRTVKKRDFILGRAVTEFEDRFAAYLGVPYAVGVGNGGSALTFALKALGVGPGDEVITQANSYIASAFAALYVGARPVLVDVDPLTFQMNPEQARAAVTSRTKVLMPVHLYGYAAPMDEIMKIASRRGLHVVEDAAQAAGTVYGNKKCGTFGTVAGFSFYPGKNLGCWGDGGALVMRNKKIAAQARLLRSYGDKVKNLHTELGFNSRLDTLQAAVLNAKLGTLDRWNQRRRRAAEYYQYWFRRLGLDSRVTLPPLNIPGQVPNFHLFVVQVNPSDRDALYRYLRESKIECGMHYPKPIHLQPVMARLGYEKGDFPVAERLSRSILSLPMHGAITQAQCKFVVEAIGKFYK